MKRILSLALVVLMVCLAALPVFAEEKKLPENCETYQYVVLAKTAPTIDGKVTEAEYGKVDFELSKDITKGQRTYCRDYFSGNGNLIPETKFQWAYDKDNIYVGIVLKNPEYNTAAVTGNSYTEKITVALGKFNATLTIADGAISGQPADVKAAIVVENGVKNIELAIPRSATGTETELQGYLAHDIQVAFTRNDGSGSGVAQILSQTTPIFANAKKTHDLFVLTENENAAADAAAAAAEALKEATRPYYKEVNLVKIAKAPTVDGKIAAGEYGNPFMVCKDDSADRLKHMANIEETKGPDVTFYWTWDDKYMYLAAEVDFEAFELINKTPGDTKAPCMYVYLLDADGIEKGATSWQKFDAIHFTNFYDTGAGWMSNTWFSASAFPNVKTGWDNAPSEDIAKRSEAGKSAYTLDGEGAKQKLVWECAYDWTKITTDGKAPVAGDKYTIHFQIGDNEGQFRLGYNFEDTNTQGYHVATLVNAGGTAPSTPSTPATPSTPSTPATFDAGIIALVVAAAAGAGVVVSKKRR